MHVATSLNTFIATAIYYINRPCTFAMQLQVDVLLRVQARDQGRVHQPSPSVAGNCGIASNSSYPCVCNSKEKPGSRNASQAFSSTGSSSEHRAFIVEVLGFPFPGLERMV